MRTVMNRKTIFLLFSIFLFWANSVNAKYIVLGYVDFPPYEFKDDDDKPSGMLVAIVQTLFKRAEIPLVLKYLPFKRAYISTKRGEIDGLFNFYKTRNRLDSFDYTEPIIRNPLTFFVQKSATIEFERLDDLKGLKIGIIRGYSYGTVFDESQIFIREAADTHESNFNKLMHGRIDTYLCDKLAGIHIATKSNLIDELKILPTPLIVMDGHIGFTKGKHENIIHHINRIIIAMHRDGEIEEIFNQYNENRF
jgi:polar amino acid transport system substrate-binding protein